MRVALGIITLVTLILINLLIWYLVYKATMNVRRENEGYCFVEIKYSSGKVVRGYIRSLEFKSLQNNMTSKVLRISMKNSVSVLTLEDVQYVSAVNSLLKITFLTLGGRYDEIF